MAGSAVLRSRDGPQRELQQHCIVDPSTQLSCRRRVLVSASLLRTVGLLGGGWLGIGRSAKLIKQGLRFENANLMSVEKFEFAPDRSLGLGSLATTCVTQRCLVSMPPIPCES